MAARDPGGEISWWKWQMTLPNSVSELSSCCSWYLLTWNCLQLEFSDNDWFKAEVHVKAVSPSSSITFQETLNLYAYFTVWLLNFWEILGHFGKERFFLKDRLNWRKYEMLKIWRIWKIEIWSEELVDLYQTVPYQPGALPLFFWEGEGKGEGSTL